MKIGDTIERIDPFKIDQVTREIKTEEELKYYKGLETDGYKFIIVK